MKEGDYIMGKKFNETLKYLGPNYSAKNIDYEDCIYRKIGKYEIEISGLNIPGPGYDVSLYLWEDGHQTKSIQGIHSKEELAKHLETVLPTLISYQD